LNHIIICTLVTLQYCPYSPRTNGQHRSIGNVQQIRAEYSTHGSSVKKSKQYLHSWLQQSTQLNNSTTTFYIRHHTMATEKWRSLLFHSTTHWTIKNVTFYCWL